jgi:hypothetical protein
MAIYTFCVAPRSAGVAAFGGIIRECGPDETRYREASESRRRLVQLRAHGASSL